MSSSSSSKTAALLTNSSRAPLTVRQGAPEEFLCNGAVLDEDDVAVSDASNHVDEAVSAPLFPILFQISDLQFCICQQNTRYSITYHQFLFRPRMVREAFCTNPSAT
jgi:hypothetical protein